MTSVTLRVKVRLKARVSSLEQGVDGVWIARLKSPPVDGKANRELIALVASRFECPKSAVTIKAGAAARLKVLALRLSTPRGSHVIP